MNDQQKTQTSKFLSLILRHKPETIGLKLDEHGWALVDELLILLKQANHTLSIAELEEVVTTNSKKRFAFNQDHSRLRASQGHSLSVELELVSTIPPTHLYHGTVLKFLDAIKQEGLQKMSRQHVHLSAHFDTAFQVGSRRGKPLVLTIESGSMHADGFAFYQSENGVWFTNAVPPKYIHLKNQNDHAQH